MQSRYLVVLLGALLAIAAGEEAGLGCAGLVFVVFIGVHVWLCEVC